MDGAACPARLDALPDVVGVASGRAVRSMVRAASGQMLPDVHVPYGIALSR